MSAGTRLQLKRKSSGNFVAGELAAGEMGLNTTTGLWWFSVDGLTVTPFDRPNNASVTNQTINAAVSAVLTGSELAIPVGKLRLETVLRWQMSLSKTAAGTAANTFIVRLGTTGTISDAAILTFALPVGTAIADTGAIDILVTIRGPLGASCIAQGTLRMVHNLAATGLATVPCVVLTATSGTFTSTTAGLIASVSCTTAASTVLTFQQVQAEALNV
jgi:hypothetical protein